MALKKAGDREPVKFEEDVAGKAKVLFNRSTPRKEKKILTTFSIEPSFKKELEDMFEDLGMCWAQGIRVALKEYVKNHKQ